MYIGVDIGGTNIKVGIVSKLGRLVNSISFKTRAPRGVEDVVDEIYDNILLLLKKENLEIKNIKGVGIGVPGTVSPNGSTVKAPNMGWQGVDFSSAFKKKLDIKFKLDNDANCAARAEVKYGGGRDYKNVVFITLGTGIGSGIFVDGKMLMGNGNAGGECGHMVIVKDGIQCNCGNKGCWEKYASASALTRFTEEAAKNNPQSKLNDIIAKYNRVSAKTAFDAAKLNDEVAKKLTSEYVENVYTGLVNLMQIFHPEAFIIGGGVSNEGKGLIQPLQQKMDSFIISNNLYPTVAIKKAVLGNEAGMIGAACLVMD